MAPLPVPFPLLSLLACHPPEERAASDVVVVLVDGLRDGEGELGAAARAFRDALPLDGGADFRAAYAQSVSAHVALVSVLTGRYPAAVPVCGVPRLLDPGAKEPWCVAISRDAATIAEVDTVYGAHTALVSSTPLDHPSLRRGFGSVFAPAAGMALPRDEAAAWWLANAGSPRLLVVHAPLDLTDVRAKIEATAEGALATAWEQDRQLLLSPSDPARYRRTIGTPADAAALASITTAYTAAATRAGAEVGAFLGGLGDGPRWVVVSSLRGLDLLERGGTSHPEQLAPGDANLLLERTLHVPLWLFGPGITAQTYPYPVELVDVLPTVLARLGETVPAGASGRDLVALLAAPDSNGRAYAEFGDMLALRYGDYFLSFRSENHGTNSLNPRLSEALQASPVAGPANFLLYDVRHDPYQEQELGDRQAAVKKQLRDELIRLRTGPAQPHFNPEAGQDPAELNVIRAQGYW